jgi:NADPH:quinone reductase-like Zn-dependent oxidoreductase
MGEVTQVVLRHASPPLPGSPAKLVNRGIVPKGRGCDPPYHALPPTVVTNFAEDPAFGAEVTGVCGTGNVELVRALGADHVIDYTRDDFTRSGKQYDLIFDNVENRSLADCRRALAPAGTLVLNSGTGARGLGMVVRLAKPLVVSPFVHHNLRRYLSKPNHDDLVVLQGLVEAGRIRPVVDKTYPLPETPAALGYVEGGHARGKVVVTMDA